MAEQVQKQKTVQEQKADQAEMESLANEDAAKAAANQATGEKLKSEIDDLLDEIDEVLEENAQEMVDAYIQKGGE